MNDREAGYDSIITHVASGIGVRRHMHDPWDEVQDYLWSEGNFSCDCNRARFFYDGEDGPDADYDCGETKFGVKCVSDDGRVLHDDRREK